MKAENDSSAGTVRKRKAIILVVGVFLFLIAAIAITFIIKSKSFQQEQREEYAHILEVYEQYGLIYNKQANRLYYNGELVRYFEDIVSEDYYTKWPNRDGTVDIFAMRNEAGELTGVTPFDVQSFMDRTSGLEDAICELQITNSIDGYTNEIEEQVKNRMEAVYEVYGQYGLTYDKERDRLYYEGELVGYFEDSELKHTFGPFDDSKIEIHAVRDAQGALTGLDVVSN